MAHQHEADPLAFLWTEMEEAARDSEVESLGSTPGTPVAQSGEQSRPPVIQVPDQILGVGVLRPMSPPPAELLSTAQQEDRIQTSGQAGPSGVMGTFISELMDPAFVPSPSQRVQETSSKKEKAATRLMTNLASGFETMVEAQEQLGSVASSSQRQSQQALDLIRREQAEREKDRLKLQAEIDALRTTLKDQMEVSREALSALENTRKELQEERDQSRSLQNELLESRR